MVYKPNDNNTVNNSDSLLQQLVPKSYLVLQNSIKEKAAELKGNSMPPIQNKEDFLYVIICMLQYLLITGIIICLNSNSFLSLMEDVEELNEAVKFLHSES